MALDANGAMPRGVPVEDGGWGDVRLVLKESRTGRSIVNPCEFAMLSKTGYGTALRMGLCSSCKSGKATSQKVRQATQQRSAVRYNSISARLLSSVKSTAQPCLSQPESWTYWCAGMLE